VKKQLGPLAAEERGALLEGWVFSLLRAYAQERELYDEIFYWAPLQARGLEVDFLLKRGHDLLALEVKSANRFSRSWIAGLKAIGELPEVVRRVVIYTGSEELETPEGIEVWPIDTFLQSLKRDSLWP